jgi:hypothetical protein
MENHSSANRRRALRAPARGLAVLHSTEGSLHAGIENLSCTGLLATASASAGFDRRGADRFFLDLRLADRPRIAVRGKTIRVETRDVRVKIAVAFCDLERDAALAIEDAVSRAMEASQVQTLLVIDSDVERRARTAEALSASGIMPIVPRTPLEAIDLLSRARLHIGLCTIGKQFAEIPAIEIRQFLAEGFPWVRVLDAADEPAATVARAVAALAETDN